MPTYEYACKICGEHLEVVQSFKDEPLTTCPACGGDLRKVFGSIGISFKGSGFYKTDTRSSSRRETATTSADKSSSSSEKSSEKSSSEKPSSPSSSPSSSDSKAAAS